MAKQGKGQHGLSFSLGVLLVTQLFSLFAAEILQFVLPLHILNLTHSGSLYGAVVAAGFVPYTLLVPIGGILADRTRKRSVMVAADAVLAGAAGSFILLQGRVDAVAVTIVVLMLAFAAQALVQPCVQSAVPFLATPEQVPAVTAMVNQVSMVTGIGGPVVGGLMFGFLGIKAVVGLSAAAFALSCLLTLVLLRVPYAPPARSASILAMAWADVREAGQFVAGSHTMRTVVASATLINLFGAAFLTVGTSFVVSIVLGMAQHYVGFAQAALAIGGLVGSAVVALKGGMSPAEASRWLVFVALGLAGVAAALAAAAFFALPAKVVYAAIVICYVATFACCMVYSIGAMTYLQLNVPKTLLGKVIAFAMMLANFATPLGQLVYGVAFDHMPAWALAGVAAAAIGVIVTWLTRALGGAGRHAAS